MAEFKLTKFIDDKMEYKCLANTNSKWRQYYIGILFFKIAIDYFDFKSISLIYSYNKHIATVLEGA